MLAPHDSLGLVLPQVCLGAGRVCPCRLGDAGRGRLRPRLSSRRRKRLFLGLVVDARKKWRSGASMTSVGNSNPNLSAEFLSSAKRTAKAQKIWVSRQLADKLDDEDSESQMLHLTSSFTNYREDPLVDKLRTQLGVIHPIPSPPFNRNIVGFFVFFFFVGVAFDKVWTLRKKNRSERDAKNGTWPQVPTSFSMFFEKDLQRKESVEWVNMVLGKLWKVYRSGIENWIIGLLQPVIDNLKKPDYVQRVEIKQFSLGDEPLSVRNVERRTSRRVNDLQYQIGLRYTGGARMLLSLSLKFGIVPIVLPVGIRDFDIDGELWVKLRLIPTEPWIGAVSWAFVSLPKIKFELAPFRLFNLMAIPVLSLFLTKLLTEDLPRLFVRPKKIVLDFQKGKTLGPVPDDVKTEEVQEGNKDFVGELSVTLVDARKLAYVMIGKTDPYVVLTLGDQVIQSKKNSQTTVIGPPGEPIWNQDFHLLVANPRKQKLYIQVKDSIGFTDLTVGTGEIELGSLQDTVPTDRIVNLKGGWNLFRKQSSGELLLRLTYKAYVEDEEDGMEKELVYSDASDDESSEYEPAEDFYEGSFSGYPSGGERESFMDVLAALLVSEEFQGIVSSETGNSKISEQYFYPESMVSRTRGRAPQMSTLDGDSVSGGSKESTLIWLAAITSIAVLIAINVGSSGLFNP
ncbi:tricalbin-3 [Canna indica]|uniref:Tricalbin-3 n=1 Tax=Canna indica TaxID=4628 RepID=A0AAQ3Q1V7_9LILI|nr:tricalbin-3 [Canna indica]